MPVKLMLIVLVAQILFFQQPSATQGQITQQQLQQWLDRYPQADLNQDGKLTIEEARAYRDKIQQPGGKQTGGAPREFSVNPGWNSEKFPESAVCYKTPAEILSIYDKTRPRGRAPAFQFAKPADGSQRIVATGHSFMTPGYDKLLEICQAAGMKQHLYSHTGGGITGSARYKWEQENGIFEFANHPQPKLLAAIANAEWDAMMWGPYFQDRPEYYSCWIQFCLKYNPQMSFYLSDAWPQLYQLETQPASESFFTPEVFDRLGQERSASNDKIVAQLRNQDCERVYVLPTSAAMVLAGKTFLRGELPGVQGIHRSIGGQERSLWRDPLGHLGPGFEWLEGYVFYATLYRKSPELIEHEFFSESDQQFPNRELDHQFRRIAWEAVIHHPLSGVVDVNGDGLGD